MSPSGAGRPEWIAAILAREKIEITPEAKDHLWSALTSLASAPIEERTLTGLSVLLQSNALKRALQPYCLGGPYGRLLDAEIERLGESSVQAFETEGLIGTGAAPAVLCLSLSSDWGPSRRPRRPCSSSTKAGSRSMTRTLPASCASG